MSRSKKPGQASQPGAAPESDQTRHFDTCETEFFEQGDEVAAPPAPADRFDDLDDPPRSGNRAISRHFMLGVVVGTTCMAVLGCVALWRSRGHVSPKPAVAAPAPSTVAAAEPKVTPAPAPTPTTSTSLVLAPSEPPSPPPAVPPSYPGPTPSAAAAGVVPNLDPKGSDADSSATRANCRKAVHARRANQIVNACAEAFAADPVAADLAVAVAKAELDRGHGAQALAWAKKAAAADPNLADAYVFIGGAEQNAGHGKAAKEAYRRYLELAPSGRYAADLRAIVGRL